MNFFHVTKEIPLRMSFVLEVDRIIIIKSLYSQLVVILDVNRNNDQMSSIILMNNIVRIFCTVWCSSWMIHRGCPLFVNIWYKKMAGWEMDRNTFEVLRLWRAKKTHVCTTHMSKTTRYLHINVPNNLLHVWFLTVEKIV